MDQFVGQLMLVPYNFAPRGWALCQGQLLPISQNTALFSLLGIQFGGDGRSTFGLPNYVGRMPIGLGTGPALPTYVMGQVGGSTSVTLLTPQMPAHTHTHMGTATIGTAQTPASSAFAALPSGKGASVPYYVPAGGGAAVMASGALALTGSGQPHPNQMPYLELNYIICLSGIFPQRP